jgi:hypothetical protein
MTVSKGMMSAKEKLMANAAILLIVTILLIIAIALYWIHFRGIWTNHSFAINDYIKDDLLVNVKRSMERILLLGDLDDTGSYVDHELSIDDTDLVKATAVGTDVVESCEKRLYAKLLGRLPSLANITQASIDEYSANTMLKEVITKSAQAESPISRVLLEASNTSGSLCGEITNSYLGLLLLLNEGDIRIVQRGAANVATMEKLRTYVTSLGATRNDSYMAHIGGCINDKSNGASKHTRTALKLSRAVCAATDLSSLMKNVVPQAKDLYDARQKKSIPQVFWLMYKPYFKAWINSIKSFFRNVKIVSSSTTVTASILDGVRNLKHKIECRVFPNTKGCPKVEPIPAPEMTTLPDPEPLPEAFENPDESNVELAKAAASDLLSGKESTVYLGADGNLHRSEGFFKAIGRALKAFAKIPEFLGMLLSNLPGIFKSLIKILLLMVKTMVRLVQLIGMFMKNPMQAVLEIFLLAVGVPCIIVLIAAENAIVTLIVMIYAVLIALPTFLLATLLCVLLFIPCVVGAVADHFLNGMIRVLARTENHPEAWWYNTAFEYYNVNLRALLSFSTCSNGYSPKNIFCIKRNGCLSVACPASMLMRAYRTGRYRHPLATAAGFRLLPNEKKSCRRTVTNNAMKCGAALYGDQRTINFIKLNGESIRDMIRALCLTRNHILPGTEAEMSTLAKQASYDDPIAPKMVGIVTDTMKRAGSGMKTSTKLGITAVAIVVFGLGIQNMVRLRQLTGSLVDSTGRS